jgi:hypothetical protein
MIAHPATQRCTVTCPFWAARRAASRRIPPCSATASSSDISPVGGGSGGNSGLIPGAVSNAERCSSLSGGNLGRRRSRHGRESASSRSARRRRQRSRRRPQDRRSRVAACGNPPGSRQFGQSICDAHRANRFGLGPSDSKTCSHCFKATSTSMPVFGLNPARSKVLRIACSATGSATLPSSANESKR